MLEPADIEAIKSVYHYYDVKEDGDATEFYGDPLADLNVLYESLYAYFSARKKDVILRRHLGEYILTIRNAKEDNVWLNVALAAMTLISTTLVGAELCGIDILSDPLHIYIGLPFALAIMAVLGSHELGHYIASKKNGIDATLPYFIPFPFMPMGTMGAIIRQKGPVPGRKALFDVGISGPLVGLMVAIVITVIGLMLSIPAINVQPQATQIHIETPFLFDFLAGIFHPGAGMDDINLIAFAGWVGMLVTVLNMMPIGQLDGGHVARAILGELSDKVSRILPMFIFGFGLYATFVMNMPADIWIFWGLLTSFMGSSPHPKPLDDVEPIGWPRAVLGVIGFGLTILCFTPFPITM